jgi:hypothetical protein
MTLFRVSQPAWVNRLQQVPVRQRLLVGAGAGLLFAVLHLLVRGWTGWLIGIVTATAFGVGLLARLATITDGPRSRLLATVAGVSGGALAGVVLFAVIYSVAWLNANRWPLDLESDAAEPWLLLLLALVGGWAVFGGLVGASSQGEWGLVARAVLAVAGGTGGAAAGATMCAIVYAVAWASQHGWQVP